MKLSQFYNKNVHSCGCIGVKKEKIVLIIYMECRKQGYLIFIEI